jgi:hypothetical protein
METFSWDEAMVGPRGFLSMRLRSRNAQRIQVCCASFTQLTDAPWGGNQFSGGMDFRQPVA